MKRSTKAVLLSTLVLPGAGHLFLRKRLPATLLILVSLIALFVLMSSAYRMALEIAEKVITGEVQPDIGVLLELMSTQKAESNAISLATTALIISWIVGVVDAFRVGRSEQGESVDPSDR